MFNALNSEELLAGIGRVLRLVADEAGELQEYQRSQALSAYSVTRLLAAEQAAGQELLTWAKSALVEVFSADRRTEVIAAARSVAAAADGNEVGAALGQLLDVLTNDDRLRAPMHRVLAELVDREVAALARAQR